MLQFSIALLCQSRLRYINTGHRAAPKFADPANQSACMPK
jgi:hypothetical protein